MSEHGSSDDETFILTAPIPTAVEDEASEECEREQMEQMGEEEEVITISEWYRKMREEQERQDSSLSDDSSAAAFELWAERELVPPEEGSTYADDHICTCPYIDQIDTQTGESASTVELAATPSDALYAQLVNQSYGCKDTEDADSVSSRFTPDSISDDTDSHMVPFSIRWSLGFAINSRLMNFTQDNRQEFFIATAHKGNIYDYAANTMKYVHGHIKPVRSAAVDGTGHYMVSGGFGYKSKIIVTDTLKCKQLLILDNPDDDLGSWILGMAPDARFFISVHNLENPTIKVWEWTYGNDTPDFQIQLGKNIGRAQRIAYHPNDQNFMMFAFEKQIIYAHWNEDKSCLEDLHSPIVTQLGQITDCTMAANKHETFVSTAHGHIAIFGNVLYSENFAEHTIDNKKMFVKKIKVCRSGIKVMTCPDNILVTLEERGFIKFFDTNVLLLYWIEKEMPPIRTISFSLQPIRPRKNYKFVHRHSERSNIDEETVDEYEEDRVNEYEMLQAQTVRSRASLQHRDFHVRDFIAGCIDGRVYFVDIVKNIFKPFFYIADSPVASLSVSTVRPSLYVAYESGRVTIFDYEALDSVLTTTVLVRKKYRRKKTEEEEQSPICNCFILISNLDIHLVVARSNGEIIFFGPTLIPIQNQRYQYSNLLIERMAFSENNQFLAYNDVARTMYILHYSNDNWEMSHKFRGHEERITDMLFLHYHNPQLYTIGADRYLVEYSLNATAAPVKYRVKIEETAIPLCFLYYPSPPNATQYFLVSNSEYKLKLIATDTMTCRTLTVGPHLGCYDTPVRHMQVLPNSHGKYIIFQNNTHMGILKTPPDGNPYKYVGALANPKLGKVFLCNQGKYVFTYAKGEGGILIWNINTASVDMLHYMGGPEFEPFYCLIEGGANGWFFKEIEDLFCYMQILHQEDAYASQQFGDSIFITDLPDLIRACGYYPSEYEIQLLTDEIENKDIEKTGVKRETVTFVEFVKLYLNHRPAHGISERALRASFEGLFGENKRVDPRHMGHVLSRYGDCFTDDSFVQCLDNVMSNEHKQYGESILTDIPHFDFEYFTQTMLGILKESAYTQVQEQNIRDAQEED